MERIKRRTGRTLLIQPKKDRADRLLDAYELEREIDALTEPELPFVLTSSWGYK